jgi:CheY-like chemotaxis protein
MKHTINYARYAMDKKILIVDDEPFIRVLLKQTLEDLEDKGVELLLAADGEEGIEIALNERPNLIFLDVMMPYVSGYEVCQRVKAQSQGAGDGQGAWRRGGGRRIRHQAV